MYLKKKTDHQKAKSEKIILFLKKAYYAWNSLPILITTSTSSRGVKKNDEYISNDKMLTGAFFPRPIMLLYKFLFYQHQ